MATTPIGIGGLVTLTPTWGTALNGLANGAMSLSSTLDYTSGGANYTGSAAFVAMLRVNLGASTTLGAGTPNLQATFLELTDGTTAPTYGVSSNQLFPFGSQANGILSTGWQVFDIGPFVLYGFKYQIVLYNNLGVAFPASGVTAIVVSALGSSG